MSEQKKRRPRWFWVCVNWMNYFGHLETQRIIMQNDPDREYDPYDFSKDY